MTENAHLVFIYGNDELEISRKVQSFLTAFPDPTTAEMNVTRLDGRALSEDDLNNAVHALPFLAAQRLVLLAHPSARYNMPETRRRFFDFLTKVPPTTRLVMYETIENRKQAVSEHWLVKWGTESGQKVALIPCMMPRQWEMAAWIEKETRAQGGKIRPLAAERLAEMVGEDTRQAAQEITKLLTYVNYARPIELEDVKQVSVLTAAADVFEMVDALGNRDGHRAQHLLRRLLDEGDAWSVFGMVVRQVRLLLQAREILDNGGTQADVHKVLHLHEFVAKKVTSQARCFSPAGLEKIYHRLLAIDYAAKTGEMPLELSLESLVVELTR
ncbi:MAG: DNA polymerase III subunit delta [Candidatus Villigracilaceae bacterium]